MIPAFVILEISGGGTLDPPVLQKPKNPGTNRVKASQNNVFVAIVDTGYLITYCQRYGITPNDMVISRPVW